MTQDDRAELRVLLDLYKRAIATRQAPSAVSRVRKKLERALLEHADDLIAAAEARQIGTAVRDMVPAPPMGEWPERER